MVNIKKSMVFIDASNLLGGWWTYCNSNGFTQQNKNTGKKELSKKIDYKKLLTEITKDTDFIRGYFYDAVPNPLGNKKQGFFDMLRGLEITIVTKDLRELCKNQIFLNIDVSFTSGYKVLL